MSSMLEQAIIDAEALRETALKNAEAALVEKYQDKIKSAVDSLLEQDEPVLEQGASLLEEEPILDELPAAAADGEKACPCPDDEEEIDINLNDLMRRMQDEGSDGDLESQEDLASEFGAEEELMESLGKIVEELNETEVSLEESDETLEETDETLEEADEVSLEETDEVSLEETLLSDLLEKLSVNMDPVKTGWGATPDAVLDEAEEEILAAEQDTEAKEAREAKNELVDSLKTENQNLQEENQTLSSQMEQTKLKETKLLEAVATLKDKFDEMSLMNAKLLYKNRTFANDSLNERQKEHIVEALSKAKTVEEAKTIFETLQSTVDSVSTQKKQSESLSEAVNKPSSTILLSKSRKRDENSKKDDPSYNRWKALAGLEQTKLIKLRRITKNVCIRKINRGHC